MATLLSPVPRAGEWSLEPTRRLLQHLGNPERHFPAIHVGGTNGKGSVCHLVYGAIRRAGYRVGLYTSPHLVDVRERFIVNDRPIPREAFAGWVDRLEPVVRETGASFFEATTVLAFADFAARMVDVAVVEVGLGGRLDSTNVVDPLVSAVVGIALDHTEFLGNSLEAIAREKAGIAKKDRPFVIGERDPAVAGVLAETAREHGAVIRRLASDISYDGPLALVGAHQRRNAAVAWEILDAVVADFPVPAAERRKAFAETVVPGRFDRRGRWIFDVAHNPNGVDALVEALEKSRPTRPLHVLAGILGDKDWRTMLARLVGLADSVYVTEPPTAPAERRWDLEAVRREFADQVIAIPDFDEALRTSERGAGTVLVTGSFHTVGDALARLPGFAPLP